MATPVSADYLDEDRAECLARCAASHDACLHALEHQRSAQGADRALSRALDDCARVCDLTRDLLLGRSELQAGLFGLCSEACVRAARACEQLADPDPVIEHCAQTCGACAETCAALGG